MENLLIVYGNSTDESTYEEMNLWYSWVHIRDVLTHRAALAAQRFELSKWQPRNFCDKHTVLCCYEIMDREYCNRWHVKDTGSWRMKINKSFSCYNWEGDFFETFWNPVAETAVWQEYADYAGERAVMTIKLKAKGDVAVADYFTKEKLDEIQKLPGFQALHLYDWLPEHQMPFNTPPAEPNTHNIVCQISNCYMVANEWNTYMDAHPEIEELFSMDTAIFEPQMHRVRDVDLFSKPEWRAIQALAHLIQDDKEGRAYPYATPEVMYDNFFTPEMKEYVDVIERKSFRDI